MFGGVVTCTFYVELFAESLPFRHNTFRIRFAKVSSGVCSSLRLLCWPSSKLPFYLWNSKDFQITFSSFLPAHFAVFFFRDCNTLLYNFHGVLLGSIIICVWLTCQLRKVGTELLVICSMLFLYTASWCSV
jgi:hypothetical protein